MMDAPKDAWDIHVHAAPSLFEREHTANEVVNICRGEGMAGVVLKAHHGSTVEIASSLNDRFEDINVYGGVVLNYFTGGLNPFTVEAALRLGGKIVWMPTIHAQHHKEHLGELGGFSFQKSAAARIPKQGITILEKEGDLKKEVKEILDIMDGSSVALATGHISFAEIEKLFLYIKDNNKNIKLLVSHIFFDTPGLGYEHIELLDSEMTWFEISNFSIIAGADIKYTAEALKRYPNLQWIISGDSGQKGNPSSPEALRVFVDGLTQEGVDKNLINKAIKQNPQNLLK